MRLSVVVPTYRRPADFERCLQGLNRQDRLPDEIIVVVRDVDNESHALLAQLRTASPIRIVEVTGGGQVQALNAGLEAVTGDIVMITDDDAVPHDDWCLRVEQRFANLLIGGVGGRDVVYAPEGLLTGYSTVVGRVRAWGRLVGKHHLIVPAVTSVDILKGANMSYRMTAVGSLRFDTTLRGEGAQVGNDMAFSMAVAAKGWLLLYDPAIQVDHYPAERIGSEIRNALNHDAVETIAFNTWWTLRHHLRPGIKRHAALLWESIIGTRDRPGRLRGWFAIARRDRIQQQTWHAARKGRSDADKEAARPEHRQSTGQCLL